MGRSWARVSATLIALVACGGAARPGGECARSFENDCGRGCRCPAGSACVGAGAALRACVATCDDDQACPTGQLCSAAQDEQAGQCWPACGLAADCPTWGECRTQRSLPGGAEVSVCRLRSD